MRCVTNAWSPKFRRPAGADARVDNSLGGPVSPPPRRCAYGMGHRRNLGQLEACDGADLLLGYFATDSERFEPQLQLAMAQFLEKLVELAADQDAFEVEDVFVDAVVGAAVLREVVRADAVAAVA